MCIGKNKKQDEVVGAMFCEGACYSLERYEEEQAVLQDDEGNSVVLPRKALPEDVRVGDVLRSVQGLLEAAPEETRRRRAEVADLLAAVLGREDEKED